MLPIRYSRTFCAVVLLCVLTISIRAESTNDFSASAGWAEVDITPPLGIGLGGRGAPSTTAKKILDPLVAQVLFMKDAKGTGFVLVSFDLIGMSHKLSEGIRLSLVHELGVEWNLSVLNFSHTHSGPYMIRDLMAGVEPMPQIEIDYFNFLKQKVILAARAARKDLSPVKIEVSEGRSQVAINRRGKNKAGIRTMIPDPNGPMVEKVWVMKLTPQNEKPSAVIFSYACHPVITYGYAIAALSADFPGVARNTLREKLGARNHVQFVQGLAGDVRPRALADLKNNRFRTATPEDLQTAGTELANDVLAAMKNKSETLSLNLAGSSSRPLLLRDKPPAKELYEKLASAAAVKTNKFHLAASDFWLKNYASGEGFAKGDAWPTGLIRLADNQWICYLAGEPCAEWEPKITEWLPGKRIVMFGYSQEGISYLPTDEMLPEGGYEVADSNHMRCSTPAQFAPGVNEAVRESLLRQLAFIEASVK